MFLLRFFGLVLIHLTLVSTVKSKARENTAFECNKTISSKTKKNGTILSPGYPDSYQTSIQCQYDFQAEGIERVQLVFSEINLHYTGGNPLEPYGCSSQDNIKVYVNNGDRDSSLKEFCGRVKPKPLMSSGSKMKVVFKSGETEKQEKSFFRIDYFFRTDFGVLGNGVQDMRQECTYVYNSSLSSSGYFTSPNYNGLYPRNTICNYTFIGSGIDEEKVNITFDSVSLDGCDSLDNSDSISFSNYLNAEDRSMPRLCGTQPRVRDFVSDAAFFRVIFKSDDKYDASGFKAFYEFKGEGDITDRSNVPVPNPSPEQQASVAVTIQRDSSDSFVSLLFLFIVSLIL